MRVACLVVTAFVLTIFAGSFALILIEDPPHPDGVQFLLAHDNCRIYAIWKDSHAHFISVCRSTFDPTTTRHTVAPVARKEITQF